MPPASFSQPAREEVFSRTGSGARFTLSRSDHFNSVCIRVETVEGDVFSVALVVPPVQPRCASRNVPESAMFTYNLRES